MLLGDADYSHDESHGPIIAVRAIARISVFVSPDICCSHLVEESGLLLHLALSARAPSNSHVACLCPLTSIHAYPYTRSRFHLPPSPLCSVRPLPRRPPRSSVVLASVSGKYCTHYAAFRDSQLYLPVVLLPAVLCYHEYFCMRAQTIGLSSFATSSYVF